VEIRLNRDPFPTKILESLYTGAYTSPFRSNKSYSEQPPAQVPEDTGGHQTFSCLRYLRYFEVDKRVYDLFFHANIFAEGVYIVIDDLKNREFKNFRASIYRRLCSKYTLNIIGKLCPERAKYQDFVPILVKRILDLPSGSFGQCRTSILKSLPDFIYHHVHMLIRMSAWHDSHPSVANDLLEWKNLLPHTKDLD
jgi:hypothetical protein